MQITATNLHVVWRPSLANKSYHKYFICICKYIFFSECSPTHNFWWQSEREWTLLNNYHYYPCHEVQAKGYDNHIVCVCVCVCKILRKLQTLVARTRYWKTSNYTRIKNNNKLLLKPFHYKVITISLTHGYCFQT